MKLSDITTDLEISKRLKEKGFPQDSMFSLYKHNNIEVVCQIHDFNIESFGAISSPTAEELLKELPRNIKVKDEKYPYWNIIDVDEKVYRVSYLHAMNKFSRLHNTEDKKLCNALALMWIYLHDDNLLKG